MADNLNVTPGTGAVVAADDVGGALYQRVKIGVGADGVAADWTGGAADNGPAWVSVLGVSGAAVVSADLTTATAVTDTPTAGQKIVIDDIIFSADTAMSLLFEEETSGTDIFQVFLPAPGSGQITTRGKVKLATADKKLTAKASVAGNVAITIVYHSEA